MGVLLRELLRTLCGVKQWSYAVFWKFGCRNPKLLIWEEYHYQCTSGIENPELPFGEWEGHWASSIPSSQLGIHMHDRVHILINKMMVNNQVNVVGEGLVGRAAFMGNHEWILANNYIGDAHPPEVLNEVHHQFTAGMQTVVVIPICPHGVVQLGSSLPIMEDMGFVNNVKSLILQLGCVPGALLSESQEENDSVERIGVPISRRMPLSGHLSVNHKVPNSTPVLVDSCHQQSISSNLPKFGQPPYSQVKQSQDNPQCTIFHDPSMTKTSAKSSNGHSDSKISQMMMPAKSLRGQIENGVVGAEVAPSNPDAWLSPMSASYNSRHGLVHQPVIGPSDAHSSMLTLLEHQILFGADSQNHLSNDKFAQHNFSTLHMRTNGGLIRNPHKGSVQFGSELHDRVPSHSYLNNCKSTDFSKSSAHSAVVGLQHRDLSRAKEVPLSSLVDHLSASGIISGYSDHRDNSTDVKYPKNVSTARQEKMDNDLFQSLDIPLAQPDDHMSLGELIGSSARDCSKDASGIQSTITAISKNENPCVQPPFGNDLYDIFGADFKNKLFNGNSKHFPAGGKCEKTQNTDKGTTTYINSREENTDFYLVDRGMSDSAVISTTDNLLDAVVSRAYSATKQSSDDNVSCKTTVTKISSSSVPSASLAYGSMSATEQFQREVFDLPKSFQKAGTFSSSSFRSGCSKDDMGSCSQTTSIYGSQLTAWVGHNIKRDSNVSTAFSKKSNEISKPNRKRLKPGENPRPRPKDRQMIQDRVKELREIVPNGAKCSIDALLERTIKHMLFLQSVTKHADKLKQTGEPKIINKDGGLLLKDNFGGATWAYEVGSQSMVCPIIVEDLNQPRQMLVEMLCEERGFFLEIADLIRGLGLTILKGVMEARDDKIWARFAVEANRDVTRMEIFMSLVSLLEQTVKGSTSSANAVESNNMMVHHALPQATPITATGRPSSLQ